MLLIFNTIEGVWGEYVYNFLIITSQSTLEQLKIGVSQHRQC